MARTTRPCLSGTERAAMSFSQPGSLPLARDERCVPKVLGDEPDLQLVCPDHVADQQVVGTVIASLSRLPRHRTGLLQDDLVRVKQPSNLHGDFIAVTRRARNQR